MKENATNLSISAVEREVGLSKEVLRVWERRYGFPSPGRDANGERLYPSEQVQRLRLVKRLMDQGMRPGRLLGGTLEELQQLAARAESRQPAHRESEADELHALLACTRAHDTLGLCQALQQRLAQQGLSLFVQDTVGPLAVRVGDEWARGNIEVYEEHLFTEVVARLLRQAIATVPPGRGPVVLMTTVPEEAHGLGLLMGEALLSLRGARCVNLGPQVPLMDIARAARAYGADVVALSFSAAFAARRIPGSLQQLRASLQPAIRLWAAGAGVRRLAPLEGVQLLDPMEAALAALDDWRPALAGKGPASN